MQSFPSIPGGISPLQTSHNSYFVFSPYFHHLHHIQKVWILATVLSTGERVKQYRRFTGPVMFWVEAKVVFYDFRIIHLLIFQCFSGIIFIPINHHNLNQWIQAFFTGFDGDFRCKKGQYHAVPCGTRHSSRNWTGVVQRPCGNPE